MTNNLNTTINVLKAVSEQFTDLMADYTSELYDEGVCDCIEIVKLTINTLEALQESQNPLTRGE